MFKDSAHTARPAKKKAKTKARGPSRGESSKGHHQVPKLADDQERRHTQASRRTRKESPVAQNGWSVREFLT